MKQCQTVADEKKSTFSVLLCQTLFSVSSVLKKKIQEDKNGRFMEKDKRILEELKSLHCDPHPYIKIFPSESDFSKWNF